MGGIINKTVARELVKTLDCRDSAEDVRGDKANEVRLEVRRACRRVAEWIEDGKGDFLSEWEVLEPIRLGFRDLPVEDLQVLDERVFDGGLRDVLMTRANWKDRWFAIGLVAKLHDLAAVRSGDCEGELWEDYLGKLRDARRAKGERARARNKALWQGVKGAGWQIAVGVGLLLAGLDGFLDFGFERGYFMLLRFVVCAAFGFWAWDAHDRGMGGWRNAFGLVALFYNPFLPVRLGDRELWEVLNLLTLGMVFMSWWILRTGEGRESGDSNDNGKGMV